MKFTIVLCLLVLTIQYKGKSLFSFLASMKEDNKDTKETKDSKSSDDSLEEWISISSSTFKSEQIYPPLSISSKRTSKLKVNSSNFLINQFYKKDSKDESLPKEKTSFFAREIESSFNFRVSFVSMTAPLYVYNNIIYTYSQILIVTFF